MASFGFGVHHADKVTGESLKEKTLEKEGGLRDTADVSFLYETLQHLPYFVAGSLI
jgi:hypothetical protein